MSTAVQVVSGRYLSVVPFPPVVDLEAVVVVVVVVVVLVEMKVVLMFVVALVQIDLNR